MLRGREEEENKLRAKSAMHHDLPTRVYVDEDEHTLDSFNLIVLVKTDAQFCFRYTLGALVSINSRACAHHHTTRCKSEWQTIDR